MYVCVCVGGDGKDIVDGKQLLDKTLTSLIR